MSSSGAVRISEPTAARANGWFPWEFGDGTSDTTVAAGVRPAWFSPFIRHTYCASGTYEITVTAADTNGRSGTMALPIHVFPALG